MLGHSYCSVRDPLPRWSLPPTAFWRRSPVLGPYLRIVVLLPHVFISQKLIDGIGLPPCRKEERAGRPVSQGVGHVVQGCADSSPGHS